MYLPASFEDQPYGRVQYFAKVVVERPWKGAIEISRHFTVLGMLDLNTDADAKVSRSQLHLYITLRQLHAEVLQLLCTAVHCHVCALWLCITALCLFAPIVVLCLLYCPVVVLGVLPD